MLYWGAETGRQFFSITQGKTSKNFKQFQGVAWQPERIDELNDTVFLAARRACTGVLISP